MASIFGFLFIILLIIFIFGISIISGILRLFFGLGRKATRNPGEQHSEHRKSSQSTSRPKKQKKIFDDDEGEYVDFEEINDNK